MTVYVIRLAQPKTRLGFTIILIALVLVNHVSAQQIYVQPMYETHWTSRLLLVKIPTSPSWAHDEVIAAMQMWNNAQTWFITKYEPDHPQDHYILQEAANGTYQVRVAFVNKLPYPIPGVPATAETTNYGAAVYIVLSPSEAVESVAAHEIGHSMGLATNSYPDDLMGWYGGTGQPSTLDLYAVFKEASCQCYTSDEVVTLPAAITYMNWSPSFTLPEVPTPSLIGLALVFFELLLFRRTKTSKLLSFS